jgi:hypothetical protein
MISFIYLVDFVSFQTSLDFKVLSAVFNLPTFGRYRDF